MTPPAVTALREGLSSARISYVVESPHRELVEGNPHIDGVIVLPKPLAAKNFLKTARKFRTERYDAAIDLHGGPTAALLTFCTGAERKIGYKIKYKSVISDTRLPRGSKTGHLHSVENHINLVKALGIEVVVLPPLSLPESLESEKRKVRDFFNINNLEGYGVVVFHIGAGNEFREWGIPQRTIIPEEIQAACVPFL
jgi:heptosyltransferase-1